MNCKKCGYLLTDPNQACPNCGYMGEAIPVVSTEPTPIQQPIESAPKKKNIGLVLIIISIILIVIGVSIFFGTKYFNKGNTNNTNNNASTNTNTNTNTRNKKDLVYPENALIIEDMSDKEVFDLVHQSLTLTYEEGELMDSFVEKLPATKLGITPFNKGISSYYIQFDYIGYDKNFNGFDHINEITFGCRPDYKIDDNDYPIKLYSLIGGGYATAEIHLYTERGNSLYKAFKKYYKETYPEGEVDEKLPDEDDSYYKFTIKTTDGHEVRIEYSTNKYEFQNFKVQERDS